MHDSGQAGTAETGNIYFKKAELSGKIRRIKL